MKAARWSKIAIRIAGILVVVSESVPMIQKEFHGLDRNGETDPFGPEANFHIRHPHHFAPKVKQRPAAVARIDLGRGLQIKFSLQLARLGADDSLRDGSF